MIWAIPAAMAAMGMIQGQQQAQAQQDAQRRNQKANAAMTEFSPWTGVKPENYQEQGISPGAAGLSGAIQGGTSGMMFGQQFGGSPGAPPPQPGLQDSPWSSMGKPNMFRTAQSGF